MLKSIYKIYLCVSVLKYIIRTQSERPTQPFYSHLRGRCGAFGFPRLFIDIDHLLYNYRQIYNISRIKSQNLNVSHLVLQLFLPNPVKLSVKARMKT